METLQDFCISVAKAVRQMAQIKQSVNSSAKVVTKLGERPNKIGQIVGTISGILNAEYTDYDEHNLVVRLRTSAAFIPALSLVAVANDKIVGHILFLLHLLLFLLCLKCRGKVLGEKLILEGHKIAQGLGFNSVILLGHPGYYPRFGYVTASRFGITAPFDVSDEAFMTCELTTNGLSKVKGIVEYPKELFN